jgi:serine/threonine-protein kinase
MTAPWTSSRSALLSALRADQTERWHRGERVAVEHYLAQHPELTHDESLLLELVHAEVQLRQQAAETPTLQEYVHRFPGHAEALARLFAARREEGLPATLPEPGACEVHHTPAEQATMPGGWTGPRLPAIAGYEVLGELGRGGMGVVYRARQAGLERDVALKMVRWGGQASDQEVARFRIEAEAVARLRHPHVVQVHAFGEHEGQPYYVMELLAGSLSARLRGGPLPVREAAELARQVALAVAAAHRAKVLHRDLKPGNVLLDAEGRVRVADFGLAKLLDRDAGQTASETMLGTPAYMAPEQAGGRTREVGPAADVWAVGAILYECLTGQPPFRGASRDETLERVRRAEPQRPSRLRRGVSADLEGVCLKCLEKGWAQRYATAQELADDLGKWLDGLPTQARRQARARASWRVGVALALACLLGGLAVGLRPGARDGEEPQKPVGADAAQTPGQQLEAELRGGGRVVFVGPRGAPRSWRWMSGQETGQARLGADGTWQVQSWGLGLVELARDPKRARYRLSAEVRHENSREIGGAAGLYVALGEFPVPGDMVRLFVKLTYNDIFDEHEAFRRMLPPGGKRAPPRIEQNTVFLTACLTIRSLGKKGDQDVVGTRRRLFKPAGMDGGPWRRLVVDVRPRAVRALWGGQRVGEELTDAAINEAVRVNLAARGRGPTPPPFTSTRPIFTPGGSLGLFVEHGVVSVRNVVLEPLN